MLCALVNHNPSAIESNDPREVVKTFISLVTVDTCDIILTRETRALGHSNPNPSGSESNDPREVFGNFTTLLTGARFESLF